MPSIINRVPSGLLGLLGSKGTGASPQALADYVQPVLELDPYYFATTATHAAITTATLGSVAFFPGVASLFGDLPMVVPSGEIWVVHHAAARSGAMAAATDIRIQLAVIQNGQSTPWVLGNESEAAAGEALGSSFSCPIVMLPLHQIGVLCTRSVLGTAPSVNIGLLVSRLPF